MTIQMTRRDFLSQAGLGTAAAILNPTAAIRWFSELPKPATASGTRAFASVSGFSEQFIQWLEQTPEPPSDAEIPTQFFSSGYTQDMLEQAWASGDLTNGFSWGLADTHTLGGIPDPKNVTIDKDGSAVLTIRRPTPQELSDWQANSETSALLREGEKNGIEMKLSVAAFSGRLPTDTQSLEASITPPQGIQTGDLKVGMVGTGWTFWTLTDLERLTSELAKTGATAQEMQEISSRVNAAEEDIGEFSLGRPTLEMGYPLWVTVLSGQIMTFMAGRKTFTKRCPRADIMQMLYEPFDFPARPLMPLLADRTVSGWLSEHVGDRTGSFRVPLKVKLEIGKEAYDPTRDAMVAPMTFSLNDKPLTPTATANFAGFETDKTGSTPANLSLTRIRTQRGDWVSIPRRFIIDFCSSGKHKVEGEMDQVRFSDVIITRRKDSPPN
jgi:hypothetical protein